MVESETTYRRNHMEAALWQAFSARLADDARGHEPPSVFLNRIKRMLELDAAGGENVFAAVASAGRGLLAGYDVFGIVMMALALVLLDAGYKQTDALFILRHIKERLRVHYEKIVASNPILRQNIAASDRPNSPTHPDNPLIADTRVYMLLAKVEMRECWSGTDLPDPFILGPKFCYGLKELQVEMEHVDWQRPSKLVIEIAGLVTLIRSHVFREDLFRKIQTVTGQPVTRGKGGTKIFVPAIKKT